MKMQKSLMLALTAGCAVVSTTNAQDVVELLPPAGEVQIGGTFNDRAVTEVYKGYYFDCVANQASYQNLGLGAGTTFVMDDVNFAPGPWGPSYAGARDIAGIKFMCQNTGWVGTNPVSYDVKFDFYQPGAFSAVPMLGASPVTFGQRIVAVTGLPNGNFGLAANFATPVSIGTNTNIWISTRLCLSGTDTRYGDAAAGNVQPAGQTAAVPSLGWGSNAAFNCAGSSTENYGRDSNGDNIFSGGAAPLTGANVGNVNDWRWHVGTAPNYTSQSISLTGDVIGVAPTPTFTKCNITDGASNQAVTVTNAIVWGQICLANGATDDLLHYLNIDTEGSTTDLAIALYDNAGALLAYDNDSGDGVNAQLTFGLGRTAAVGAGQQYDGRSGQLPAGTYYLGIGPTGSSFAGGFSATAGPAVAGTSVVNFGTNVNAGGLPAAVAPVANHMDFTTLGPAWGFPATDTLQGLTPATNPGPKGVLWSKFEIAGFSGSTYLDLDFGGSYYSTGIDNQAYLFNSAGDLVAFSDDQTATHYLPLMSFGAANPARTTAIRNPVNDPAASWAGQNGPLADGVYYLASVAWPADVMTGQGGTAPTLGTGRRWHVRGTGLDDVDHAVDFYTGQGAACDSIDFNNDGLFPDTLDIDDFLSVFSGGPCSNDPNCGDIDYNNDGLFPDTLDIDALLSVFSGGPCLL